MWICPLCHLKLDIETSSWQCSYGHTFDRAKQGYVNLLPVQQKKSKLPGDNRDMVNARTTFLTSGAYQPLVALLSSLISTFICKPAVIFEAGCGEGYYLRKLACDFPTVHLAGNDISKEAVLKAAKQMPLRQAQFVVGNSFAIPIKDNACDVVLQIFAPAKDSELVRICQPGGIIIEVQPQTQHLQELKTYLFDNVASHQPRLKALTLLAQENLTYHVDLTPELTAALIGMTPLAFSSTAARKEHAIHKLKTVTIDFAINVYESGDIHG